MGWRRSLALTLAVVVTVASCSGARAEEQARRDTNHRPGPTRTNLFAGARSGHQQSHEYPDPGFEEDDTEMNYDYFIQPIPKTRPSIPFTMRQRTAQSDSSLRGSVGGGSDTTDKGFSTRRTQGIPLERQNYENVNVRDSTRRVSGDNDDFNVRRIQNAWNQESQNYKAPITASNPKPAQWEDQDPFSVFYDSMFPEMESVIPEEETYSKNSASNSPPAPVKTTPAGDITTVSPVSAVSAASSVRSPAPVLSDARRPTSARPDSSTITTTAKTQPPSYSNSLASSEDPETESATAAMELDKLTTRMSAVLEKFGLSKAFTKKVFEEEVKFLESMMRVKPLREKLDAISHLHLNAVAPNIDLSHLLSKVGLKDVGSKIDLGLLASKFRLPDILAKLNLTNIVAHFDIEDVARIVDLVEATPNVSLKHVAERVRENFGHSKAARILKKAVSQARRLSHIVDPESLHRAAETLGLPEDRLEEVFEKVEASARFLSYMHADDFEEDDGAKFLFLPVLESASLNVVQSLGFTVLLVFLLLSAYSFVALKTGGLLRRKDPSKRARNPVPLPGIEWDLDDPEDWRAAVSSSEGHNLPWEQREERENHQTQDQGHFEPHPDRPIPVPDPGVLQWASNRPPGLVKPHGQHIKTHRGPLVVPLVNVRNGNRVHGPKKGGLHGEEGREGERLGHPLPHPHHHQPHLQPPSEHQHQNQHHQVRQHQQKPQHPYQQKQHQRPPPPAPHHHQFPQQHHQPQQPYQHQNQHHQDTTQHHHRPTQPDHRPNQAPHHQNQHPQPFLQPSAHQHAFTHIQPYDPDHYDKHRHFASYDDDYEHEGEDEEIKEYVEEPYRHQHHFDSHHPEEISPPDNQWHSGPTHPTHRPADQEEVYTHYKVPSPNPPTRATRFPNIPTTWKPKRINVPVRRLPSRTFPTTTTIRPTTTTTAPPTTTPPTSPPPPPHSRPTSKYAQRVTSSQSEKKREKEKEELKTQRPKPSKEE